MDDPVRPEPARKIASIGVGLRGWITYHGFALNVTLDPAEFAVIVPCGLRDVAMTSVARELGAAAPANLAERAWSEVARAFETVFGGASTPRSSPRCASRLPL